MMAFSTFRIVTLAIFATVFNQINSFPYTGYYQPLTSAALLAAGTPQATAVSQTTTGNVATPNLYTSPTTSVVTGIRQDGTYTYGYRTPDGQVISINYAAGAANAIPVVTTGTAQTSAVATNTIDTAPTTTYTGWPTQQVANYPTYYPLTSLLPQQQTTYTAPQQVAQQSAALTAPAPAAPLSSHAIAEQLAAALTQQTQYQTVPYGLTYGTNPQIQTFTG